MDVILSILAVVLLLVGIVGCVLPIIPGQVLAYCGLLCCYFCSYSDITTSYLWIYLALTAIVTVADFVLPAYMTKLSGGSRAGSVGATVGLVVGMLLGSVVGAIVGPFIGAVVGELVHDSSSTERAIKVGFGSFISFLVGTGLKLIIAIILTVKVFGQVFPALANWFSNIF